MARRSKIPQGIYKAHIGNLSHEGRGIADIDGKKIFIAGGLPGEDVEFEYKYVKRKQAQGQVTQTLNQNPNRVEPKCKHFQHCGGCALQHLEPQKVVEFKQSVVLEQMAHFARVEPETIAPPVQGPIWGYRTKARLGIRYVPNKGGVLVGFRERFSNRVAVMDNCAVLDPRVGSLIEPLKTVLESLSIKAQIPQIEVATTQECAAIILRHLEPFEGEDKIKLSAFCKEFNLALYAQAKGYASVKKIYPEDDNFLLHYTLADQKLKLYFHPLDFTQVNTDINQQMLNLALGELTIEQDEKVLDLFCGIGNFTLALGQKSKFVTGVEGSDVAIERANYNKAANDLSHIDFHVQDLFQENIQAPWVNRQYDKILLDPPRSGALNLLPWLGKQPAKKLVYVSCNPATLARDTGILVHEHGFKLKTLRVMDMFPHTAHVESMATFERG